jgi:hypothetical protein
VRQAGCSGPPHGNRWAKRKNAAYPMRALAGMVRIHAHMMLRAMPHFTALAPRVVPTPMMEEVMMWVVDTGMPTAEEPRMVIALAVSAEKPSTGRSLVIL